MKEQRYILETAVTALYNGSMKITPSLNAENVKDKDLFYENMFLTKEEQVSRGVDSVLNREEIDKVIIKDWIFDYLEPEHMDDSQVRFICDFHGWIGKQPDRVTGVPISKRMKEILERYTIFPEQKFYEAKVLFQGKYHEYFVWEMSDSSFNTFVDFEHSIFCEEKRGGELGEDTIKVKNQDELFDIEDEKDWRRWAFKRAFMKPEYRTIDSAKLAYPYGIVISERLKNALEQETPPLTGFEIKPFPIEFEYLE